MARRRAEGLSPGSTADRFGLAGDTWGDMPSPAKGGSGLAAARGARPAGYVGHRVSLRTRSRSTRRKIFSKIVLASAGEFPYSTSSHGGVAQLGERLTGSQEVRGSIPLVSTRALNEAPTQVGAFFSYLSLFAMCWPGSILATYPLLIADMNVNNFTSLDGKASLQRQ